MVHFERPRMRRAGLVLDLATHSHAVSGDLQGARCVTITPANLSPPSVPDSRRSERHYRPPTPQSHTLRPMP